MCWSLAWSATFASIEAVGLAYIAWRTSRARLGTSAEASIEYAQRWMLPLFGSAFLIELLEALLWAEGDNLTRVADGMREGCTRRNASLTRLVFLVLCMQPLFFITATRHTGYSSNLQLLRVPEALAVVYAVGCVLSLAFGELGAQVELQSLASSGLLSDRGLATCTYIGKHGAHARARVRGGRGGGACLTAWTPRGEGGHRPSGSPRAGAAPPAPFRAGHLHWVFRQVSSTVMPSRFGYFMVTISALWARPWWVASGLLGFYLAVFAVIDLALMGRSSEAGSVWCWSAFAGLAFLVAQPRLFAEQAAEAGFGRPPIAAQPPAAAPAAAATTRARNDSTGGDVAPGSASDEGDSKSASDSGITDIQYYDEAYRAGQLV